MPDNSRLGHLVGFILCVKARVLNEILQSKTGEQPKLPCRHDSKGTLSICEY